MREAIFQKIQEQMAENLYPGASLSLYADGAWQDSYFGQTQEGQPTRAGLLYDLASVSKVVGVGTVLIFLLQAGKIELDAPLKRYYPAVGDETLTIRQLATHTSGIDPYIPHRDELDEAGLREAINQIRVTDQKDFRYTDINLILLGFMLEEIYGQSLDQIFQQQVFEPWQMNRTSFGPVDGAVPTVKGQPAGLVHDPKARVLGVHTGSAGLFSELTDLQIFLQHYLEDDFAANLTQNFSPSKPRSIVWNLEDGLWLDHTGYTGPFIMVNRKAQKAAIFLTNRTYHYDDRPLWIAKRRELKDIIKKHL